MNLRDHKPFATATLRLARRVALPLAFPLLSLLAAPAAFALADTGKAELQAVQGRWADIHYGLPEKQREAAFAELAERAARAVAVEPEAAELRIWHAIVLSTWAGAKGGLGALGLVKEARTELETALRLDPRALDGSAYTSLGSLYYQVPGWPLGFGDDAQAEKLLKQALAINPGGIDPNYFYGDFLSRQKRYAEARTALEKALAASDRPGRESADAGRRAEARRLLEQTAQEGDALAMNDLAVAWELDGSLERAREMYVLAAAQGYGVARANYLRLERQNRSSESARLARLRTLSDDGNADATLQLAQLYHQGKGGVQRDFAQAIQLYRRAADGGSRSAREFLALIFSRSSRDNSARGVDAAWMEELATRINARTDAGKEGRDMLSDRPRRSEDALWNLTSLRWTPPVTDQPASPP